MMLKNNTDNIIYNYIFLKTTLICSLLEVLWIQFFLITSEMGLNYPYTKKQQLNMGKFQILAISYF